MDLTDIWQEHKKFIITVMASLLLLLIGSSILGSTYPVGDEAAVSGRVNNKLRTDPQVSSSLVREVSDEVDQLRARLAELVADVQFVPDDYFVLKASASNPRAEYFRIVGELQSALVDEAERQGILVSARLGLKERAPADPAEIRRTLRALNVIQNVAVACIQARVREIVRVVIEDARTSSRRDSFVSELRIEFEIVGDERAIRAVLEDVTAASAGQFLEVTSPTYLEPMKNDPGSLKMRLNVAALSISTEGLDLEAES